MEKRSNKKKCATSNGTHGPCSSCCGREHSLTFAQPFPGRLTIKYINWLVRTERRRAGAWFLPVFNRLSIFSTRSHRRAIRTGIVLLQLRIGRAQLHRASPASKKDHLTVPLLLPSHHKRGRANGSSTARVQRGHSLLLFTSHKGLGRAGLPCAHGTSTVFVCAFCEQEGPPGRALDPFISQK